MPDGPVQRRISDPQIDIAALHQEDERRLVAQPLLDAAEIENPGDSVRIDRSPRAQTGDREMLQQPWWAD